MAGSENTGLSASLEDYLEAIFNISERSRAAHSKEIAASLGVSMPSVTGALRLLSQKGLANYRPYGSVTLTESGKAAAAEIARKHDILMSFFVDVLGVDAHHGHDAACRAEHALGPEIITRLLHFIDFVGKSSKNGSDLAAGFREFCQEKAPNDSPQPRKRK